MIPVNLFLYYDRFHFASGRILRLHLEVILRTLATIHKFLFGEIYDFAGKLRDINLAKGNFRFAPVMYLDAALTNIEKMPQRTFDEESEKGSMTTGNSQE